MSAPDASTLLTSAAAVDVPPALAPPAGDPLALEGLVTPPADKRDLLPLPLGLG